MDDLATIQSIKDDISSIKSILRGRSYHDGTGSYQNKLYEGEIKQIEKLLKNIENNKNLSQIHERSL